MESSIGERMKSLRIARGMTLAELGGQVSLSPSYLSQIERDRLTPSLTTLMGIAQALAVEPRYFFETGEETTLVRRSDQAIQPENEALGMTSYSLSTLRADNILKVNRVELQPYSGLQELAAFTGEEMCFILSGEMAVTVGEETHTLQAGDSIHYDALLPHSWLPEGDQPCVFIWGQASYV